MTADLIFLLEAAGYGTYGTDIFKGSKAKIPTGAGPFTSIIETGGTAPEGTHNSTEVPAYVRPSAQLVVRATTYDAAKTKIDALYLLLFPIRNRFINGTWWRQVTILQEPFDLQPDDVGRARLAFNINCVKRLSPSYS